MVAEHNQDQIYHGEISPVKLRHGGTCDPIRVDILQCVTNNTEDAFAGVEKLLWGGKLPHLLFRKSKYLTPLIGTLSTMPVKKYSLGLQNTVT